MSLERLIDCIGEIEDFFVTEAETADVTAAKIVRRKKIVKYGAAGLAVSVGVAVAYLAFRPNGLARLAKSA